MKDEYTVYMHIFPNGKKYIGCCKDTKTRWQHGWGYVRNKPMFEAIISSGWDNIEHKILFANLTKEEALRIEHKLIISNQTYKPEYGFNVSQGEVKGAKHISDDGIERIRTSMSKRFVSEDSRRKMSQAKKGKTHIGVKRSEETRAKISESRKGKRLGEDHPNARAVRCMETGAVFSTLAEAEEQTGVSRAHICQVCKGKRKTAGKLHWEYVEKEA